VGGDSVVVALEELMLLWPSPDCEVGSESQPSGDRRAVLPLGRTSDGVVTGPPIDLDQGRHVAVLGETGMGKSSLLVALARRALRESGGIVFDPLGDTVRSLRRELRPAEHARCLWVAPDAAEIGLNALEGIGDGEDAIRSERRLNDLVHALRRVRAGRYTDSGYWGPRLEEMVTRALRAAAALPDGTLVDSHTLLATSTRLGRAIPSPAAESIRELADRIRDRPEDADGARRLLHEVVRNPVLARLLCAPRPTVRTRDLVSPGRIVLISGDAARVGESTARYLLSVLLALVWSELLSRPDPSKTFVFLDEAQWFSNDSLAEMLRLGRRKNVHVVLATQAIASLPETVAEAVWTNVSDFVAFRGSPEEAREFARVAPGVPAGVLLSLPRGEAAVLLGKGESVRWVRTVRLPSPRSTATTEPAALPGPPPAPLTGADPEGIQDRAGSQSSPDRIVEELLRIQARLPEGAPMVVDVRELRQSIDPEGESIRKLGSLLSRSGALSRVDRSEGGHKWIIDRSRLSTLDFSQANRSEDEGLSATTQPS
jgi:DNA helicase HerA-like ATPase